MTTSEFDGHNQNNEVFFSGQRPNTAGFLRGLVEAVIGAAVTGAIVYFEAGPDMPPEVVGFVPLIIMVLRTVEGFIDERTTNAH